MNKLWILLVLLLGSVCAAQNAGPGAEGAGGSASTGKRLTGRQPVLLELFTAEGCPSCPFAEQNLAFLQIEQPYREAEIITLAFHVDYWDGSGWKDPYASPLFTQRQKVYDRKFRTGNIYTPQMVVDGDIEFVGTKIEKAEKAITRSVGNDKAGISLSLAGGKLSVSISGIPRIDAATVYLAIAQDGISSDISRGENAGKTLSHVSVVRSLTGIGRTDAGSRSFSASTNLSIPSDWDRGSLKAVVFVQENHNRKIHGAGWIAIGPE